MPDRDAKSGEYVSAEAAAASPETTVHATDAPRRSFILGVRKKEILGTIEETGEVTHVSVESMADTDPQEMRVRIGMGNYVLVDEEALFAVLEAAVATRYFNEGYARGRASK